MAEIVAAIDRAVAEGGITYVHYWLPKDWPPAPIMPNVICVDYSAGKSGPLVPYSFDPERAGEGKFTTAGF
ncbi:MAG: hypothetical protein WAK31_05295 [Chthoniobacterales bacterium]